MHAAFLTDCYLRVDSDDGPRPSFVVATDFRFWSAVLNAEIVVPAGTTTDGPSIPVLLAPLVGGGMMGLRAAVIHDWLCRSSIVPREQADRVFLEALRCCGVDENAAGTMYYAVRAYSMSKEPPGDYPSWQDNMNA